EELALMHSGLNLKSDVLKVAHHGSKTSSHLGFLKIVNPWLAIISDGRNNKFGHPHQIVLDNLADLGIKILRTDILGDINLVSDGKQFYLDN
ncbi:MBL fold metallo-hydrolase, partial [Candidatus Azambacteria bacterium]|nr:MBL fold metallo-hydrolase [Candidatus Azambacteria bacterium]